MTYRSVTARIIQSLFVFGLLGTSSCEPPTSFKGEPKFPGGPTGCYERCREYEMDMATFVFVGDYSTACACKLKETKRSSGAQPVDDQAATVAAAAGVELQRRRIEEQQRQQQQQQQMQQQQVFR